MTYWIYSNGMIQCEKGILCLPWIIACPVVEADILHLSEIVQGIQTRSCVSLIDAILIRNHLIRLCLGRFSIEEPSYNELLLQCTLWDILLYPDSDKRKQILLKRMK